MDEQDTVVNETVETTTSADSTPDVNQTTDGQSTPAGESTQPDRRVSEVVPRSRLNEEIAKRNELLEENARLRQQFEPSTDNEPSILDPEADKAVTLRARQVIEEQKAQDFIRKHATELQDPILSGTVAQLIARARTEGTYIDQEDALAQAKELLDKRLQPQVQTANTEGLAEGQKLAREKQQAAAIGDTNRTNQPPSDEELTADQYAAKYNLRITQ